MKKYENMDNVGEREHRLEIKIQLAEYKGTLLSKPIGGNCFGLDVLNYIDEDMIYDIDEYEKTNCSVKLIGEDDDGEEWFKVVLNDEDGNETEFEDECRNFRKLIVGISIHDCIIIS